MEYTINPPGAPALRVTSSLFTGRLRLYADGREVTAFTGRNPRVYALPDAAGHMRQVELRRPAYDIVPELKLDGYRLLLAPPLAPWQAGLALLPLLLAVVGGLMGTALGGAAFILNLAILRSCRPVAARLAFSLGVTLAAAGVYAAVSGRTAVARDQQTRSDAPLVEAGAKFFQGKYCLQAPVALLLPT
ncbi:hypothetical protein [Hymenobacter coalescens]